MHYNSVIKILLLFKKIIYQRSWSHCSPSLLFSSMHIILRNSAWASCKAMDTTSSRQNPTFECTGVDVAEYLRIVISAYVLLHFIAQCLNTQISRIISLVLVAPRLDRYRLRGRIFLMLSMKMKNNSVIWVQRAYHKEFGYEKTPTAAKIKG